MWKQLIYHTTRECITQTNFENQINSYCLQNFKEIMRTSFLDKYVEKVIPICHCQKSRLDKLEEILLKIKENTGSTGNCNPLEELNQMLQSSLPDLKIICGDGKIVMSHKLLFGLTNECLAEIFSEEDFINDPLTILKIPNSSGENIVHLLNRLSLEPAEEDTLYELFFTNKVDEKPLNRFSILGEFHSNSDNQDTCVEVKDEPDPDMKTDGSSDEDFHSDKMTTSKKFECPICSKSYGIDYYKRVHKFKCKNLPEPSEKMFKKKEKCFKCNVSVWKLDKHLEKCDKIQKAKLKSSQKSKEGAGDPVSCDQCGKVVTNKYCLKIHIESVHNPDKQVYSCDQCSYTTTYKRNIMLHIRNIHEAGEFIACHICGVKIKGGASNLSRHIFRLHTESQTEKVKCEECGKEVKASQLSNHKKKVHGERRFACHMCSYRAQTGYNLKLHISQSHLGVKELPKTQCQYCDVITTNLPHHMKLFHGDK